MFINLFYIQTSTHRHKIYCYSNTHTKQTQTNEGKLLEMTLTKQGASSSRILEIISNFWKLAIRWIWWHVCSSIFSTDFTWLVFPANITALRTNNITKSLHFSVLKTSFKMLSSFSTLWLTGKFSLTYRRCIMLLVSTRLIWTTRKWDLVKRRIQLQEFQ